MSDEQTDQQPGDKETLPNGPTGPSPEEAFAAGRAFRAQHETLKGMFADTCLQLKTALEETARLELVLAQAQKVIAGLREAAGIKASAEPPTEPPAG